jgi:hypothetical protein
VIASNFAVIRSTGLNLFDLALYAELRKIVTLTRIPFAFTMLTMFLKFAGFFRPDHDPPFAR